MEKTKQLIIIRGTSGSGKTTIAKDLAIEKKAALFSYDIFLFDMLPYKPENKEHFELGLAYMKVCLKEAMVRGKNIVLEGSLITTDKRINPFDITDVLKLAKKYKYSIFSFKLHTEYAVAAERMKKRANIVDEITYKKIEKALNKSVLVEEKDIYTDQISISGSLKIISNYLK